MMRLRIDLAFIVPAILCFLVLPASAQYKVRTGDVLELDVAGIASMKTRLPIDSAGMVRVPLLGSMKVAGQSLDEINDSIRGQLTAKTLPQLNPNNGQLQQIFFEAGQISVNIAEYRPIYVSGDVATPGQYTYRPGLTVRQVISLAGGHQSLPLRSTDAAATNSFDWQAELNTQLINLARDRIRLQRVRSELAGDTKPPQFASDMRGVGPEIISAFVKSEIKTFELNVDKHAKELKFQQKAIENAEERIALLREQQEREKEGMDADTNDHNRLLELARRGATTTSRLTDARRNILFSSTRYLQTTTQIGQIQRELATHHRDREKLEEARRTALREELWRTLSDMTGSKVRIKFLTEKLAFTGFDRSIVSDNNTVTIKISRQSEKDAINFVAKKDDVLEPGDVVEVVTKASDFAEEPVLPESMAPAVRG